MVYTYTRCPKSVGSSNKMEFEELKIEVPMGDDESDDEKWHSIAKTYENKAGTFVTGFDVNSQEAQERRRKRGKRFSFQLQEAGDDGDEKEIEYFSPPEELPEVPEGEVRADAVFLHGVDHMSTKDVFKYFEEFGPSSVEWIDDHSCNVVWDDDFSASRAMSAKSHPISVTESGDDEKEEFSQTSMWRVGIKLDKAKCLLMRHSTKKDRKQPGAARRSLYYLEHGHPNSRNWKGRKKGIVSGSRKRKIMQERERARHIYSNKPEVEFVERMDVDDTKRLPRDNDDDDDGPPLKIVLTNNDASPPKTEDSGHRMRMYADDASDTKTDVRSRIRTEVPATSDGDHDDDDDDDDDDEKEDGSWRKRDRAPVVVDLRAKLKNKQILGFDYTNRPSLSIEIKEEGS